MNPFEPPYLGQVAFCMETNPWFNAHKFRNLFGDSLIGQKIVTQAIGSYPGGVAKVVELDPDPKAPEIVIQVFHPTFGEIGIFDYERVRFA